MNKQQRKRPQFHRNKMAFDATMRLYRRLAAHSGLSAMQYGDGTGGSRNPAKPTAQDFRIDCDKVIAYCTKRIGLATFIAAYILFDSEDSIELQKHAQKLLGDLRHGVEQGMGALFIKRGLTIAYFRSVRGKGPEHRIIAEPKPIRKIAVAVPEVEQELPMPEEAPEVESVQSTFEAQADAEIAAEYAAEWSDELQELQENDPFFAQSQGLELNELEMTTAAGSD